MITVLAAVAAIRAGEVVVVPTDTVYGLAGDPSNPEAVERIYAIKGRPEHLELNLLASDLSQLDGLVEMDDVAYSLAAAFWPGPLSLVCRVGSRRLTIPRVGTTLMVRIPGHALLAGLLEQTGPVASTSANLHGHRAAATAAEAEAALGSQLAGVLDGGPSIGMASTIIDASSKPPRVLRQGPIDSIVLRPFVGD